MVGPFTRVRSPVAANTSFRLSNLRSTLNRSFFLVGRNLFFILGLRQKVLEAGEGQCQFFVFKSSSLSLSPSKRVGIPKEEECQERRHTQTKDGDDQRMKEMAFLCYRMVLPSFLLEGSGSSGL